MKSCKSYAVIGLGFGDEGKGLITNALCHSVEDPLVVRYSGGQQAGHTVTMGDGCSHVFSNFGSGSFNGIPTYWSKYCTIDPVGIMREHKILKEKGISAMLEIDVACPVTTPYEKFDDQTDHNARYHGTCGVGVGKTFAREESFYSLTAADLLFRSVVDIKMDLMGDKFDFAGRPSMEDLNEFYFAIIYINNEPCIQFVDRFRDSWEKVIFDRSQNIIFEGSQGVLLDQHNGFFPHVTRSNTGTKNILEMCEDPQLYLVTRAYQTRHGNGPMTNEEIPHNVIDNPNETNVTNLYQGEFRKRVLDLDLLRYATIRDEGIRRNKNKVLVITCCDLIDGDFLYTLKGELKSEPTKESFGEIISDYLGIENFILVDDPVLNKVAI